MPTTDENLKNQVSGTAVNSPASSSVGSTSAGSGNEEFDLEIVGTKNQPPQEETSLPIADATAPQAESPQEESQPFDFSLDLPDSYTETNSEEEKVGASASPSLSSVSDSNVSSPLPQEAQAVPNPSNGNLNFQSELVLDSPDSPDSSSVETNNGSTVALEETSGEGATLSDKELFAEEPPLSQEQGEQPNSSSESMVSPLSAHEEADNLMFQQESEPIADSSLPEVQANGNNITESDQTSSMFMQLDQLPSGESALAPHTVVSDANTDNATSDVAGSLEPVVEEAAQNTALEAAIHENSEADQSVSGEASAETEAKNVLNLDEMILQFGKNSGQDVAQSTMDPFTAMKATLAAEKENKQATKPSQQNKEEHHPASNQVMSDETQNNQPLESSHDSSLPVPQSSESLSTLDSRTPQTIEQEAQPQPAIVSQTLETPAVPAQAFANQTLDLDMLTSMPIGTASPAVPPASVAPVGGVTKPVKMPFDLKKIAVLGASLVLVVILGVMVYIRYPDLFVPSSPSATQVAVVATGQVAQNPDEAEHGAPSLEEGETKQEIVGDDGGYTDEDFQIQPVEPILISDDDIPELETEEIQLIDLTQEDSQGEDKSDSDLLIQEQEKPSSGNDGLSAVEELIGPINNNDLLHQEVLEYQRKGLELKEMGLAQNNRTMTKYGLAIEKETQKLVDLLANGENIDISTWSSLKEKLDDYLVKGSHV